MKKIISLLLCIVILTGALCISASAAELSAYDSAVCLRALGLFKGTDNGDFELDRTPSREEALVMLIRLLGKEAAALSSAAAHPFTDVSPWSDRYVAYAFENGITEGSGADKFGTGDADAAMYLTFILRALGYSDKNGDFSWSDPFILSKSAGILPESVDTANFTRGDMVLISYAALSANIKNSSETLAAKLISSGVFSQDTYDRITGTLPVLTSEDIYAKCAPAVFSITACDKSGTPVRLGSGFFIDENGTAVTNHHVIEGAGSVYITTHDGETAPVLGIYDWNEANDWAVMKTDLSHTPYLTIGSRETAVGGAEVYAIGNPLGLKNTMSEGIISAPSRISGGVEHIQTSAPISHGSSGGPLLNKYGEVIGIITATYPDGQNLNLAVPISVIDGFNRTSTTSLPDFAKLNPLDETDQKEAFRLFSSWLTENGTKNSDGTFAFSLTIGSGSTMEAVWDPAASTIYLKSSRISDGMVLEASIALKEEGTSFAAMFFHYPENELYRHIFAGFSHINAPVFSGYTGFTFEAYDGDGELLDIYRSVAKGMCTEAISFAQSLFETKISTDKAYSMEDFGFSF